jgi:hypothetical protein
MASASACEIKPPRGLHAGVGLAATHVVIEQAAVEMGRCVQRRGGRIQRHGESRAASAAQLAGCHARFLSRKWRNPP